MYLTDEILEKLNAGNRKNNGGSKIGTTKQITLPDIMVRSFAEVKALAGDVLSWGEKNFLYQQAQKELKENKMADSRILSRANPQLANAVRLGIRQSSMLGGYDDLFPQRAARFVKPGSVASMFSPAGYLTELYREARNLHAATSPYNLDKRRPDLASLSLSQRNMDDEVTTLSLSNELLLDNIQTQTSKDYDGVIKMLSSYRLTGDTPYNQPYEAVRQSILLQDPQFTAFRNNPVVMAKMDIASLLSIQANISPELRKILTEKITEDNADNLIKKNFGDVDITSFQDVAYLSHWYDLTYDEITSILGIVHATDSISPGVQYYQNDQLISFIQSDGSLHATLITRANGDNTHQVNYAELIPLGNNHFQFNYSFAPPDDTVYLSIGTKGALSDDLLPREKFTPERNTPYSATFTLSDKQLNQSILIGMTRRKANSHYYYCSFRFRKYEYPFSVFLLKLNKLIRLCKATGIAPTDIRTVLANNNSDLTINDDVLSELFRVNYYMQRYGIDVYAALVLAGSLIGQTSHGNQASGFTRLFNAPMLNNTEFSADGTVIKLAPADVADTFRTGVMKRAFGVNDTELYTLWSLTTGDASPPDFVCTIKNLSDLYRVSQLAHLHNLSVTELAALLSVSPYAAQAIDDLSNAALAEMVSFIEQTTSWLKDVGWTVSDLYLVLTDRFSTILSPDIENLITTLKNGLASQDLNKADEAALITAAAPFIAAATQLDSAETAAAILQWLSKLKPQKLTIAAFLALVDKDSRTDDETATLVAYCQVMGQLVLIARNTGLSASELSWVVAHPTIITEKVTVLGHDIATLRDLTALQALLARCGTYAAEILTSLSGNASSEKNNLAVKTVATALALDEQALTQALKQCSAYEYFYSWIHLKGALQWLDVANTFNITPAGVAKLVKLTYSSPYADGVAASLELQAGLNGSQTTQLSVTLDETLSSAASAYVIKNIAPSQVTSRDKLYNWLLIDNQISAQVKTTRIAQAIASIQLYVNRALSDQEENVVNTVKSKPFFTSDWDTYNKRYSTWAGVSQLVYYPENYVDPTLRIGQTGMLDEMLQTLSQSQLTSDTVEGAFKTYMTRFEEIANLDIISGYHNSVSEKSGTTYLVGRSGIGDYYWRSADINKMSDGKLPANAWSEWKKIIAALTPVNNLVRPVIFQSRLYLVWVESREIALTDGGSTTKSTEYLLKYAHILHDGTWSDPVTVTAGKSILPLSGVSIDDTGMYCAKDVEQEKLYILFYKKEASSLTPPVTAAGLVLSANGTAENMSDSASTVMATDLCHQLDTTTEVRLNTPYAAVDAHISASGATRTDQSWGYGSYSIMHGCRVSNISATLSGENAIVTFKATARVLYNGHEGRLSRRLIDMVKSVGSMGDTFYLPRQVDTGQHATFNKFTTECIVSKTAKKVYFQPSAGYLSFLVWPLYFTPHYAISSSAPTSSFQTTQNSVGLWEKTDDRLDPLTANIYVCRSNPFPNAGYDFKFSRFDLINTHIYLNGVKLIIPEINAVFTSDSCSKYTFNESLFDFNQSITIPLSIFSNNTASLTFKFSADAPSGDGRFRGSETFTVTLTRVTTSTLPVISLNKTIAGAQYLQYGAYRIRVNTLFAKQLVARANTGLNTVLSMETQQLQEPKLGEGSYVEVTFGRYDAALHGDGSYRLYLVGASEKVNNIRTQDPVASGSVSNTSETSVTVFVPWIAGKTSEPNIVYIGVVYSDKRFIANAADMQLFTYNTSTKVFVSASNNATRTRGLTSNVLSSQTEPMDFSGANALYFWEMFYYVPMMVFKRLLSESKFTEAMQWIKYIWSPDGYLVDGQPATYAWNVRPLEDETTWHADPLDSVDPDAVAQADPMHYKIATFTSYLDLLIARGDAAYRQLERDTLNEAKMWYVQALDILGDEPYLTQGTGWASPRLADAASQTTQLSIQQALLTVRQPVASRELRTANSLTNLFLPQQNEKLAGYWQTLAQRLYNLRHNLSIDGNPLSLSIYAPPVDPEALLSAAVNMSSGGSDLPASVMPLYRFPVTLESARGMVQQLIQFGSTLLSISERQDAEALLELQQTQGSELLLQSVALQDNIISEIDADKTGLEAARNGAQSRLDSYTTLYDEDVNINEKQAMDQALIASVLSVTASTSYMVAAGLDAVPNIYGFAVGGSCYGGIARALGTGIEISAMASRADAERISQSEAYRRRRQEWEIQRNNAESEVKQIDAQLNALEVRREGAVLQKTYLETQQAQMQAQMMFLQNKFTSKALYSWLHGKLTAIYYQFYDLTVSRCLMAQEAYRWTLDTTSSSFIRPGAWQGTYAGLMAGETLMLNLTQMEQSYLQKGEREKEVIRTVCLSEVYAGLSANAFTLADQVVTLVTAGKGSVGTNDNGLTLTDSQLRATLKLSDLNINDDYPVSLGNTRRIKQISVTLPALVGPYQDVRAVLSYGGSVVMPRGCSTTAVSHGMNDSGQFQLDFGDSRWLPFEGIPVGDAGTLTLSFPQADGRQKNLLLTLTDIILNIRYTIIS